MFILLSICLVGSPQTCREERLDWSFERSSGMACLMGAQGIIAQWHESHPRWRVARWRCASRGSVPNEI